MSWQKQAMKQLKAAGFTCKDRKNGEYYAIKGNIEVNFFDSGPNQFEVIRNDSEYLGDKLNLRQVLSVN